ncbi:MAG: hypothetical protein HY510_04065 [Acidobacteria bacterium]|nr:hypothetical protein [Acidobacteriota bacterium]
MKRRRGRLEGGALLRFGVLIAALSCGPADAQNEPPPASAEPEIHPEAVSPFETRVYKLKPKRLWKGLLEALEEAGFPPEEIDEGSRTIKTSFVDFKQSDYSEQVAGPPPLFAPDYHILQMIQVVEGKVSLEAAVSEKDRGSELRLRARILVQGLDRRRSVRVLTDRRSSGVIESEFLTKLEEKLGLKRL